MGRVWVVHIRVKKIQWKKLLRTAQNKQWSRTGVRLVFFIEVVEIGVLKVIAVAAAAAVSATTHATL